MQLSKRKNICVVIGTRPEAIKLVSVIRDLKSLQNCDVKVCLSGQHNTLVKEVLDFFAIETDFDLQAFNHSLSGLSQLTSFLIIKFSTLFEKLRPNWVLVHGDTNTTLAASMAAFYSQIKIAHVEAGLRTGNIHNPFPEEYNRKAVALLASLHFAPTELAKSNLLNDGVSDEKIYITGNSGIDALLWGVEKLKHDQVKIPQNFPDDLIRYGKKVVITAHRRENFGKGIDNVVASVNELAKTYPEYIFIYITHPNPSAFAPAEKNLRRQKNIFLLPPLQYGQMLLMLQNTRILMTDSGGLQEEAPSLGIFTIVLRDFTERQESTGLGLSRLVGTNRTAIVKVFKDVVHDQEFLDRIQQINNPYGHGMASKVIIKSLLEHL